MEGGFIQDYTDCLMALDVKANMDEPSGTNDEDDETNNDSLPSKEHEHDNAITTIDDPNGEGFVPADGDTKLVPVLGMEFDSDDAAMAFYDAYAMRMGFGFRVGRSRRSKGAGTSIIMKRFVCSKEGYYKKKKTLGDGKKKRDRMSQREGCNAMMEVIKKGTGTWAVCKFVKEHSHPLGFTTNKVGHLRTLFGKKGFDKREGEVGDVKDQFCQNCIREMRKSAFVGGEDVQTLLEYLRRMQLENPSFFYAVHVDDHNRVTAAFWADAKMRMAYNYFGDAVRFDTTFKMNKRMIPFAVFSGVNHHVQPVIFGCALIIEESVPSYVWLFETWLAAMPGPHPVSLVTELVAEEYMPMIAAVERVFVNTRHRYCKWQIISKCKQKLARAYSIHPDLKAELKKCINESETIEAFDISWCSMISKYELRENAWLQSLHEIRYRWIPAFLKETFFAELSSSQRLPTMDTFFKAHFSARPTLQAFIAEFEKELIRRHELEAQAELDTTYTKPTLKTASPIEKQAAEIYTRAVFDRFQEEFVQSIGHRYDQIKSGVVSKYSVARHDGDEETFIVSFDASKKRANCSCNKFEFAGILCGHILTIFIIFDLRMLPEEYILNRWTRNAKSSTVVDERAQESTILRYNDILGDATKCAEKASMSVEVYKVAKEALQKAFAEISAAEKNVSRGAQRDAININEESTIDDNLNDMSLYIPPHV